MDIYIQHSDHILIIVTQNWKIVHDNIISKESHKYHLEDKEQFMKTLETS